VSFATLTGLTSKWFTAHATECSSCSASIRAVITLNVPVGIDFDLYVYSGCGALIGSSTNGSGQSEQVTITKPDTGLGNDDSYDYWVEVRFVLGSSCSSWTLTFQGTNC